MTISSRDAGLSAPPTALERLALGVASCLEEDELPRRVTDGLVEEFGAAFARLWRVGPGDLCATCFHASLCEDRRACLHLAASSGLSDGLHGTYQRVPFANLKLGNIASRREAHWTNAVLQDPRVAHKDWARQHGLRSFAGYPLVFEDELLGVLAVFGKSRLPAETFRRLGVFAQQTAIALRNARLFSARTSATA